MTRCALVTLLLWSGCAVVCRRPLQTVRAHSAVARAACRVEGESVRCGDREQALSVLGIAAPLRSSAPRALGGLWLLDAESTLHRVDARATVTGRYPTPVAQLITSEELVCVRELEGALACAIDRHDERGCTAADTLLDFVAVARSEQALIRAAPKLLCQYDGSCLRLTRPCQTACLRFPSCHAPLRCLDACAADQPAIRAEALTADSTRSFLRAPFIIGARSSDS